MKRLFKILFLKKSIRKSKKRLEALKKDLAWYNDFEVMLDADGKPLLWEGI